MFDYCLADGAMVVESWFITEIQKLLSLFQETRICGIIFEKYQNLWPSIYNTTEKYCFW